MERAKVKKINGILSLADERADKLNAAQDLQAEELLEAGSNTPLGQLLGKISELPEVRLEKVFTVRRQISLGQYEIDEKLDASVDRILEELIVEP